MSENSSIEWTDTTWNPVTGCTKVSPGCAHCYAETFAERFRGVPGHPFEQGFDLKLWPERLSLPLGWKKPRRIFVNSMSDLFHEEVPFEFIDRVFAVMALAPQHTFQVLTKRPERIREYLTAGTGRQLALGGGSVPLEFGCFKTAYDRVFHLMVATDQGRAWRAANPSEDFLGPDGLLPKWPLPNVWLGTSTENQHWLDIRVPELLATPAAVRFLSCEPLLGPLVLRKGIYQVGDQIVGSSLGGIDWVIVGGESGPKARSMDVGWARSIVEQCRAAGVACFVKQLGAKPSRAGLLRENAAHEGAGFHREQVPIRLKSSKGGDMGEWPEDLRVREMPNAGVLPGHSHEFAEITHFSSEALK